MTTTPLDAPLGAMLLQDIKTTTQAGGGDDPSAERLTLQRLRRRMDLPEDLRGGTLAMREAGQKWLPKEGDETDEEYSARLSRTVLTNLYWDTICATVAKPFQKSVALAEPLPPNLEYLLANADGTGKGLTVLLRDQMRESAHFGMSFLLVDIGRGLAAGATHADVMGRKPKIMLLTPFDVIGIEHEVGHDGDVVVTSVRIKISETKRSGQFGEVETATIREIEANRPGRPGFTVDWTWNEQAAKWIRGSEAPYSSDRIPLFPHYCEQDGPFGCLPPFEPLAWINLLHYQSDSDQRAILSIARLLTIVALGWNPKTEADKQQQSKKVTLGPRRLLWNSKSPSDASFQVLETSGNGIRAGSDDLAALEKRAERFGARCLTRGLVTATATESDDEKACSNLLAWITRQEHVALRALRVCYELTGQTMPASQAVSVFKEFTVAAIAGDAVDDVFELFRLGALTKKALLQEVQRYGRLSASIDVDQMLTEIEADAAKSAEAAMQAQIDQILAERAKGEPDDKGAPPVEDPNGNPTPKL